MVLVVEDDPDDRLFIGSALKEAGFADVEFAEDGAAAIERLAAGRPPGLIILDLMLPKLGGLDVLTRLREREKPLGVPVVIFTSSRQPSDVKRAYALGANSYVSKPIDPDEFARAVRGVAEYWLRLNLSQREAENL